MAVHWNGGKPKRRKRKRSELGVDGELLEHGEQKYFVQWFRFSFPKVRIFAIPNGGHRHWKVAVQLKEEGVEAGVSDLQVPAWSLWIEMKRKNEGRLSTNQKAWKEYLEEVGYTVLVAHGREDAKQQVLAYWNYYRQATQAIMTDIDYWQKSTSKSTTYEL